MLNCNKCNIDEVRDRLVQWDGPSLDYTKLVHCEKCDRCDFKKHKHRKKTDTWDNADFQFWYGDRNKIDN